MKHISEARPEAAIESLHCALQLDPQRYRTVLLCGQVWLESGHPEEAIREWSKVPPGAAEHAEATALIEQASPRKSPSIVVPIAMMAAGVVGFVLGRAVRTAAAPAPPAEEPEFAPPAGWKMYRKGQDVVWVPRQSMFVAGSEALLPSGRKALSNAAAALSGSPGPPGELLIEGYADRREADRWRLGLDRATYVAEYLNSIFPSLPLHALSAGTNGHSSRAVALILRW